MRKKNDRKPRQEFELVYIGARFTQNGLLYNEGNVDWESVDSAGCQAVGEAERWAESHICKSCRSLSPATRVFCSLFRDLGVVGKRTSTRRYGQNFGQRRRSFCVLLSTGIAAQLLSATGAGGRRRTLGSKSHQGR